MLKNKKTLELFDKYIESYGENGEVIICIEEMSELTKELAKYIRYKNYQEKYESDENSKIETKVGAKNEKKRL